MRRLVVLGLFIVASFGVATSSAFAYFTATGVGTGAAATGTLSTVTVDAAPATPTTPLLPGLTGDATFKVTNPNGGAVRLTSVVGNGSVTVTGGAGCTSGNAGVTFSDQTGLSITIPANAVGYAVHLPGAVSMSSSSANGCQGSTFSFHITITAAQP